MQINVGMLVAATAVSAVNVVVKDKRYCELLFVHTPINGSTVADVYNTFGLNTCPAPVWNSITPANIKDNSTIAVVLNGPRYWLMDEFGPLSAPIVRDRVLKSVQGLNLTLLGRVPLPWPLLNGADGLYKPSQVTRSADFRWRAGSTAFYLTNKATGDMFIMQSYSQQVNSNVTLAALPMLGSKLRLLPPQWSYDAVVLQSDVNVTTPILVGGKATVGLVLQDELSNSYTFAGDLDRYLADQKPCTEVSVAGDATYCIADPRVCSGSGPSPVGTACPSKGDVAVKDCWPHLPSFVSVNCVAPRDATCRLLSSNAWGCA
ncbi:hypothetical protein B5M09_008346 [Aphanomyces astaci]|nr:hypothetical protein B5M09_008346 [Aphanomyces astaci]